jgi:integrase
MPRSPKSPRLYLKRAERGRNAVYVIRDGAHRESTGFDQGDRANAEKLLARYIDEKYTPPKGVTAANLFIDEVVAAYLKDYATYSTSREFLMHTARPIAQWWTGKTLSDVNGTNCRRYVAWRIELRKRNGECVSEQTARHDLKTLRAAINWYRAEHAPLMSVPKVTLPKKKPARTDYWLERDDVAKRIRVARRHAQLRHVARVLLIGVYTGTRPGAIFALKWIQSPHHGWFDLEGSVLNRVGGEARQSNKRQPPARIHARLLPHLYRWRRADLAGGITSVVHYKGEQIEKLRRSWATIATLAGAKGKDAPHVMRHTAATWLMQAGTDLYEAAGYLGMSPETLWNTYGKHHPDFQRNAASAVGGKRKRR